MDAYSWYSVVARGIVSCMFLALLYMQLRVLQANKTHELDWLRVALFVSNGFLFMGNVLALVLNLFRQGDGNFMELARHISLIVNPTAMAGYVGLQLYIYLRKK